MHTGCRYMLKTARLDAKEAKVKIPKISCSKMHPEEYMVFIGDQYYEEFNECCAYHAKAMAIYDYIDQQKELKL